MTDVPPASSARDADGDTPVTDPLLAFAELGRINLSQADLSQVLDRVATLAKSVIPGADEVSVTLVSNGVPGTATFTGEVAMALDESQYDSGYGPCLDAAAQQVGVRRGRHGRGATVAGLRRGRRRARRVQLAVGRHPDPGPGVRRHQHLRPAGQCVRRRVVALAQTFAGYAAVAIANAHLYSTTVALADQMAEAMSSRAVIEQAKGILMAQRGVSAQEAFDILSRASQAANRKLPRDRRGDGRGRRPGRIR